VSDLPKSTNFSAKLGLRLTDGKKGNQPPGQRDNPAPIRLADELIAGIYYVCQSALAKQYLGGNSRLDRHTLQQIPQRRAPGDGRRDWFFGDFLHEALRS
jgi:hypothetical protein